MSTLPLMRWTLLLIAPLLAAGCTGQAEADSCHRAQLVVQKFGDEAAAAGSAEAGHSLLVAQSMAVLDDPQCFSQTSVNNARDFVGR